MLREQARDSGEIYFMLSNPIWNKSCPNQLLKQEAANSNAKEREE